MTGIWVEISRKTKHISRILLIEKRLSKLCKVLKTALSSHFSAIKFGAPEGIRTPDLLVRSQSLYPTELQAQILNFIQLPPRNAIWVIGP